MAISLQPTFSLEEVDRRVRWSPRAISNLDEICDRIAADSLHYASRFGQRVEFLVRQLLVFPRMGRVVPEYDDPNIRELMHQNYRVVYRLRGETVEVAAVVHAARQLVGEL